MSALVFSLLLPQWRVGHGATRGLTTADLDGVDGALDEALDGLGRARPGGTDGALVIDEMRATVGVLRLCVDDARRRLAGDGSLASVPTADRAVLQAQLDEVAAEHVRLWKARFRPGGLADSLAWFDHLGACYRSGEAPGTWFGPGA
jgi:hypothetical protein